MTVDEKLKAIKDTCNDYDGCNGCPLFNNVDICHEPGIMEDEIERNYIMMFGVPELPEPQPLQLEDVIAQPKHYCREGAMECIDEMIMLFGKEAVKHFCLCNIWKYRYRSADKNGKEDIEKSDQYIRIYKELLENGTETF